MQTIKAFILPVIVILALGGLLFFSYWSKRVPSNPDGTLGNTAGNLLNKGLFCESDGKIYFVNPYDGNTLYSMNPDETQPEKITTVGVQSEVTPFC